ncbi:DinB family protein [Siminovitchia fortis]|nr:DinB family protein [Siminovitchia fortis]WHY81508.1 DinB family protein [Siminovitchia fortis]
MFEYSRAALLIALGNTKEGTWDERIKGFPNTIRWNAGHMYVTAEDYLSKADKTYEIIHPEWFDFFIDGTSPFKWDKEPPAVEEIMEALKNQGERIMEFFNGKLDNAASETVDIRYLKLDTVDAALQFVTWHDGIHLGIVKSMQYVMK